MHLYSVSLLAITTLIVTLAAMCAFAPFSPALAQAQGPSAQAEPAATRIELDEQANVIRFFVKGKEKARLTEAGLQVREDIEYGGILTDVGTASFDAAASGSGGGRDAP